MYCCFMSWDILAEGHTEEVDGSMGFRISGAPYGGQVQEVKIYSKVNSHNYDYD